MNDALLAQVALLAALACTPAPGPESRTPNAAEAPTTPPPEETTMTSSSTPAHGTFGDDVAFLKKHTEVVVLSDAHGRARVAVAPDYQGRVMTSSASGDSGTSFGWIHRPVIEKGERQPHMTVLGGEDRFWLGPEGGQFGLYFPPGAPFDFEHWQVPEPLDWGSFAVTDKTPNSVAFDKKLTVQNHSGAEFRIRVRRTVRLLDTAALTKHLGTTPGPRTRVVGFETDNVITNVGNAPWTKETGLVSIWILGMFTPSPDTVVVIPITAAAGEGVVRDDYFGSVPPSRLRIVGDTVFFKADGLARGKIGIAPSGALPVAGSFDAARGVLTIVQFSLPTEPAPYVDSRWTNQADPYAGDVTNSYNDGPAEPGKKPMGPFYEIESSSPAAALAPGESLRHVHRTIHLEGPPAELDAVSERQLRVRTGDVRRAFEDADRD